VSAGLLIAIAAIVIAPLIGYLTATRKLSGKITTSDASDLWMESRSIRQDYRTENERLRIQVGVLEAHVEKLETDSRESIISHAVLVHEIGGLRTEITTLRSENAELLAKNLKLTAKIVELEAQILKLEGAVSGAD
jgi:chromosome segregation ATPase